MAQNKFTKCNVATYMHMALALEHFPQTAYNLATYIATAIIMPNCAASYVVYIAIGI